MKPQIRRASSVGVLGALLACCLLWLLPQAAQAKREYRQGFFDAFPSAVGSVLDDVPSRTGHCGVCHYDFSGGGTKNPFGERVQQVVGQFPKTTEGRRDAILSIQSEDPEADGYNTNVEVTDTATYGNTPTFPGLNASNVSQVSRVTVSEIQGHLTPVAAADTTPPAVTVIAPNGGNTLLGNAATTIQWTATDAGGVAAVNIRVSLDGGLTWDPVALGIANTGSFTWFVPNRPTAQGRIRVEATDNSFNTGSDISDTTFGVLAPPGGAVPTTLRDFDMPGTQPFEAGTLNDPAACAVCHGGYDTAVEPYANWQGSMMAQASLDPLFEACMAVSNQDAPDAGDLCLRCHIPRGWLRGRSVPTSGSQMLATDKSGVSCDLCHRLVDPIYSAGVSPVEDEAILAGMQSVPTEFANGMFVIDPTGARRGPFVNAATGHPVLVSPFHREAALCGTCHDVSNTAFEKDGSGNYVPNAFDTPASNFSSTHLMPIERTYSEWLHSAYNAPGGIFDPQMGGNKAFVATCQDCHLRDVSGYGCNDPAAPLRDDLPLHDMTGGSAWMASKLSNLHPGQANASALADGAARSRSLLARAAFLEAQQQDRSLAVIVTNRTGHKLPTGYPEGRRIWINVKFYDHLGGLIAESGAYDESSAALAHDAALKVYESKPGLDAVTAPLAGKPQGPSFHFVLNNKIHKDNRIPPQGFVNATFATFGGAPVGATYADGQFWDTTDYAIPSGATSVSVTLYYQSTSREYIEFLRDENTTNAAGQTLYDFWASNGKCPPEVMAAQTVAIALPGDVNGDGYVNAIDLLALAKSWTLSAGDAGFNPACDFNDDGNVNVIDLLTLSNNWNL